MIAEVIPPSFLFQHVAQSFRGGVAILHHDLFTTMILPTGSLHLNTIELLHVKFSTAHSMSFMMCPIYHPSASSKSSSAYLQKHLSPLYQPLLEISMFILMMMKSEPLHNLLESFNLLQHVYSLTHKTGHIPDLAEITWYLLSSFIRTRYCSILR